MTEHDGLLHFFCAAATFYRASPWTSLGTRRDFAFTIAAWDVCAFFSLHGAPDHDPILFLFADRDFAVGRHHAVTFERLADLHPSVRAQIVAGRLPLASEDAVPIGTVLDDAWRVRVPLAIERDVAASVMFAVAAHVAAGGGECDEGTYRVASARGDVDVSLAPEVVRPRFAAPSAAGNVVACSPLLSAPDGTAPSGGGSSRRR